MITNETSTQQSPLPTEPAGSPGQLLSDQTEPAPIPPAQRWTAWLDVLKAFGLWVMSVILLVFVPVIVALPYFIYTMVTTGLPRPDQIGNDKILILLSIIGIIPTHLLTLGMVWLVVTEGRRYPFWKTIGFEWPRTMGPVLSIVISFLLALVLLVIGWAVTELYGGGKTQLDLLVESSIPARFATAFVAVFTAPLVEELIYRGVLYSAIERALGVAVAVGVVSLLFAGVHVFQYSNNIAVIVVITLLSFTLTLARAYTGKVLPSFIIHLVFNGIQSLVLVLAPFVTTSTST